VSRTFVMGRCLGKGGFGEVYAATLVDGGDRRPVAVKLLHEPLGEHDQAVQRMQDEARLLERLSHPNILEVIALTRLAGRIALVTEYVDGADLSTLIRDRDLPIRVVLEIGARVASALHAAHSTERDGRPIRLVHRDVKPSNIRVGRDGTVKLLDFGIARSDVITRAAVTASDMVVGSPPYLAPERFRKGPPVAGSDVFSLGASLYEALTGHRLVDLALAAQAAHALDPELWRGYLARRLAVGGALEDHPELAGWLGRLLAHDPGSRPAADAVERGAEALADTLPGASLVEWAHARVWAPERKLSGHLAGQILEENALHHRTTEVRANRSPPTPPAGSTHLLVNPRPSLESAGATVAERSRGRSLALVAGLSALGGLAIVAGILVVVATGLSWLDAGDEPVAIVTPRQERRPSAPEGGSGDAAETPAKPAAPAPSPPAPAAIRIGPQPRAGRAEPVAKRAVVSIRGASEQACLTPRDTPGRCAAGAGERVEVDPGEYAIWRPFAEDPETRWPLDEELQSGEHYRIRCDQGMQTCSFE